MFTLDILLKNKSIDTLERRVFQVEVLTRNHWMD